MSIVAVTGDLTTTTAVALASAWPTAADAVLIEADPTGGDLAAWLDMPVTPSLSTVVTRALDGTWPEIERHTRLAASGLRVIPAPAGGAEAGRAVGESIRSLAPTLAALRTPIVIADTGRLAPSPASHPFVAAASVVVLVHRQASQSAAAAAVRFQRLADQVDAFAGSPMPLVVALVGGAPFTVGEVDEFLRSSGAAADLVGLPHDALAAAVYAGRRGVSARRLSRLPLSRAARSLAAVVERRLSERLDLWPDPHEVLR